MYFSTESLSMCVMDHVLTVIVIQSVSAVTTACREMRQGKKFSKVLEVCLVLSINCNVYNNKLCLFLWPPSLPQLILMTGNYMNAGSRNQQSYGFDLSFLTKLGGTKSADQKTTLLHFLANVMESKFPDLLDFATEMRNVEAASRCECLE